MNTKECVAMILADGRGEQLGALTHFYSKPAVYFGGNYRIIDFALSNCKHSGIRTVGILSQFMVADLHAYISMAHEYNPRDPVIHMLPPYYDKEPYMGTADAVYKNIGFIDRHNPKHVLVLAGDQIYKMNYNRMLTFHRTAGADVTIASAPVHNSEALRALKSRAIKAENNGHIYGFEEKQRRSNSNLTSLASMGVYVFKWSTLKKYLLADNRNTQSSHDFERNILPDMLRAGESMYTYAFGGYWRDVGTVENLWKANMDQLDDPAAVMMRHSKWNTVSSYMNNTSHGQLHRGYIHQSIVSGDCQVLGDVSHSVLGDSVTAGHGSEIVDSVVMPNVYIGDNVKIHNAVVGPRAVIMDNAAIGTDSGTDFFIDLNICSKDISLVAPWLLIPEGMRFKSNSHIYKARMDEWDSGMMMAEAGNY